MAQSRPLMPRVSIGAVRRAGPVSAAASQPALQGVRDGVAAIAGDPLPPGRVDLRSLRVELRAGAGAAEIAAAVRDAVAAAIRDRMRRS
jgi:hypothetical protein